MKRSERRHRNRIAHRTIDAEHAIARLLVVVRDAVEADVATAEDASRVQNAIEDIITLRKKYTNEE